MRKLLPKLILTFVFGLIFIVSGSQKTYAASYGVFTQIAVNVPGSYSSVVSKVKGALNNAGWKTAGISGISLPKGDMHKSTVIVATNGVYNKYMVDNGNAPIGAFGLPLRVAVWTTPNQGTVVGMVNLPMLAKTFSGNSYVPYALKMNNKLKSVIRKAVGGTPSNTQGGAMRSGRFPGGIGGGSFPGSVDVVANYSGSTNANLEGVAYLVKKGIKMNTGRWHFVYEINDPSIGFIEIGVSRGSTESHSISIDSGARATSTYKNPGIDHSTAFPIEIVVYRNGNNTNVGILGEMWRMKYYFSDAGMWAFMTHMGMPGSVQGSLSKMILKGINS